MAIQKRKWKNSYTYRVQVYSKGRVVANATFDRMKDAKSYEANVKAKLSTGEWVDKSAAENMILSEALDKYNDTESKKKKGDSYRRECSLAKQIKKYPLSNLPLSKIRSADVATFRDQRLKDVGVNSVRLSLALLGHVFTVAIQEWHMDYLDNPVHKIKKPSVHKTARDRRLVGDEEKRLLASAVEYGGSIADIINLALETAMRQGEIVSIKPEHVDLEKRLIHLFDTKNGEARSIPLSLKATAIMRSVMGSPEASMFSLTDGEGVRTAWQRVCSRAKSEDRKEVQPLTNLRFHDLRHEATSRLFEKGLSTEQVMSITGHKTYSMLARYTHLKADDLVKLLD